MILDKAIIDRIMRDLVASDIPGKDLPRIDLIKEANWTTIRIDIGSTETESGEELLTGTTEEAVTVVAEAVKDALVDEGFTWPICSAHGTHPYQALVVGGVACWVCPVNAKPIRKVGDLERVS